MHLPTNDQLALTKLLPSDREAVVQHLQDPCIAATTVGIPWPYTCEDFTAIAIEDTQHFELAEGTRRRSIGGDERVLRLDVAWNLSACMLTERRNAKVSRCRSVSNWIGADNPGANDGN